MTKAMDLTRFEVCPDATDPKDPRVYRGTVRGLRNPVAEYVAAADAETILALISEGCTNKEVAVRLGLSDKTVKNYLSTVFEKLHVSRRAEAAAASARWHAPSSMACSGTMASVRR